MNKDDQKVLSDFKKDEQVLKFVQLLNLKADNISNLKSDEFSSIFYYIVENYSKKLSNYTELEKSVFHNPIFDQADLKKLIRKKNDLVFTLLKRADFI